jgi:hypothetical protein
MITARRLALPLVIITSAAMLAGCEASFSTGDDNVNADDITSQITTQYKKQTGLELSDLTCDEVEAKVGATFKCTASNSADVSLDFDGKINKVDEGDDKVGLHWEVATATAGPTTFTSTAVDALQGIGRAVDSIECPGGTVIEKGNVIDCVGTMDDGSKRQVKITLKNGNGDIHVDLLGPA